VEYFADRFSLILSHDGRGLIDIQSQKSYIQADFELAARQSEK
jgi:hypothetical protein